MAQDQAYRLAQIRIEKALMGTTTLDLSSYQLMQLPAEIAHSNASSKNGSP
jgi:hypothetical protein